MKIFKDEKGSAAVYTTVTMVFLVTLLVALYSYNLSVRKAQLKEVQGIKQIYEEEVNSVDEVYDKIAEDEEIKIADLKGKEELDKTTPALDDNDKTVWIPKGFRVDEESSTNQDEGIVITDKEGNEFVWVPVQDPTTMFVYQTAKLSDGVTTTNKYSKLRVRSGDTFTDGIPGSSNVREPDVLTDYDDNSSYIGGLGYSDITDMAEDLLREYNEMARSIETYHGFYIGRYELSGTEENPTVQSGKVLTASSNNWYDMNQLCKNIIKSNTDVKSIMIYGCQWDETMSWLKNTKFSAEQGKVDSDSSSWGNYNRSPKETGKDTTYEANKIYDLAGNYSEWTQEATGTGGRILRGGYYNNMSTVAPASDRNYDFVTNGNAVYTTRASLIIS